MTIYVMDSSAILAVLKNEPGEDVVRRALPGSIISAVNAAEVGARLADRGAPEAQIPGYVSSVGLEIVSFDAEQALMSAALRNATRPFGLSLGDRACLALARRRGLPVLTADAAWVRLRVGVEIELIRRRAT
jgi:PIN domain nuclease of toxin-antitoxin system